MTDQRVHKVALTLHEEGHKVVLVGRKKSNSSDLEPRPYKTKRFTLLFEKGILFYANYNLRLFFYLLFTRFDMLLSNDLDTLLPNFLVSKIKKKRLVYDTHEYFTGVPELINRHFIRNVWKSLENYIFPKLETIYTVNDSIARLYGEEYSKNIAVVRNLPMKTAQKNIEFEFGFIEASYSETAVVLNLIYEALKLENRKIIIYQGAVNKDRGLEEMIEAMQYVENALLLIIGTGDLYKKLKNDLKKLDYSHKIVLPGPIPMQYLSNFTKLATIGISIEKPTNINYKYASPNKVVDYIHAGVPVLASKLVEVEKLLQNYQVGGFIDNHSPTHIAARVNEMIANESKLKKWRNNCKKAAEELNWEKEKKILKEIFTFPKISS